MILKQDSAENPFTLGLYATILVYCFLDIYIVMYLGNEIEIKSTLLSYSLFESNWIEQSKSCKKCMILLMEVLKRSKILVVGKLFPLNLKTFTSVRILGSVDGTSIKMPHPMDCPV